jgi:hypothetical protein
MLPIKTEHTNVTYVLKGGTKENDLPIEMSLDEKGFQVLVSTWELSDEELLHIKEGGRVRLVVWGAAHPPVSLSVHPVDPTTGKLVSLD